MTQALIRQAASLTVWLVILVAIFVPLEQLCALHPKRIWRKQMGVDLGWYFINSLLPALVLAAPLALLAQILNHFDPGKFYSHMATLSFAPRMILTLIVNDVGAYWGHRALHSFPFLWRFHAVHHSAEELDWLVNTRAHPFDIVFTRLSGLTPVYLLGLAHSAGPVDRVVLILSFVLTIWTFFIHANIRIRLGAAEWLVSSPAFHHWHHTRDEHRDRNFAFIFPLIDRVFGTSWLPKHWPSSYGITTRISSTIAGQFFDSIVPAPEHRNESKIRIDGTDKPQDGPVPEPESALKPSAD